MIRILTGDCRDVLPTLEAKSVQCVITSPPYFGLRDYGTGQWGGGIDQQIGLESTVDAYVAELVAVFREVWRVLRDDGTLWLNLGDSYAAGGNGTRDGSDIKPKDLIGVPWRVAFALQADGWYLRQDIIWSKPNPMPESVRDRCTKSHEYLFLLTKRSRYFYDAAAIAEPATWDLSTSKMPDGWDTGPGAHGSFHRNGREKGQPASHRGSHFDRGKTAEHQQNRMRKGPRFGGSKYGDSDDPHHQTYGGGVYTATVTRNKRSVWTIATHPMKEAHFATFPPALVEPCIRAGSSEGDTVLDPFFGAGTTGLVADRLGRHCIGIELNPEYAEIARRRITGDAPLFAQIDTNEVAD